MKNLKYLIKLVFAGIVALAILCGIATVYSLSPMRVENEYKNTDYAWENESLWIKMTEGISCGITDEKGFNNLRFVENPDVLLLGSSHIEGMNVQQKDHVVSLLNDKLEGKLTCYNMGVSGHTLFKVVQYLEQSMTVYETVPKYVVIETSTTVLSKEDVDNALNGEVAVTTVNNQGVVAKLQRLPFLRQVYHQLDSGMMDMLLPRQASSASAQSSGKEDADQVVIDEQPYKDMFEYLKMIEEEYGTLIIIVYHPFEILNEDGSISFEYGEYTKVFADYSDEYKVGFIDMTADFEDMYYEEHHVAHGFSTGELGVGHINKYGHKAIADSIYEYLSEIREGE